MSYELEFAYRIRQTLDQGVEDLDTRTTARLRQSRLAALDRLDQPAAGVALAGVGNFATSEFFHQARGALVVVMLLFGAVGTYYWNSYQQASEQAEIESALLADKVPFNAYIDQGFMEWLDHLAQEQQGSDS
jgi:Protein of unknown function (DUF3619)